MYAYSEALHADVHTDQGIGGFGTSHTVVVVRMHRNFADEKWPASEVATFWDTLAPTLVTIDVFMGDFGKMVLKVVPELRSRGVIIDLAAWYPFRTVKGEPWVCSSAIFFLGRPGAYKLKKGLADAHGNDPTGILWVAPADAAVVAEHGFPILEPGAYGHRLSDVAQSNLVETLTPLPSWAVSVRRW